MKINRAILPPGRIGLAVSGGSDSVALAFLLTKGGKKKNAAERFVILHVDHGLRRESKEEYRFVRALARCVRTLKLDAIATGHHMDDVAETFLMRIRRASGPEGLAGIKERTQVGTITFVRPLLGCRDAELKDYLRKYGETWREDASNDDTSIERNKVRHRVIPFLEQHLDPNLVPHIAKITRLLTRQK